MPHQASIPQSAARKHVLLGMLARAENDRLGLGREPAQLAETMRWVRARYDLVRPAALDGFLSRSGLSTAGFHEQVRILHDLARVQEHHQARIDDRLPRYRAMFSIRDWLLRRSPATPTQQEIAR